MGRRLSSRPRVTRRQMLAATASAMAAAPLATPAIAAVVAAATTKFFTASELAMVDELTDIVIPTDAHSPGAKAAGVAAYVDARLAESVEDGPRQEWRAGLQAVDALSTTLHGRPFMQASAAERVAVVTQMAAAEGAAKSPVDRFFETLKRATVHAYYTSKIGIHQEMEYKGNTLLPEFVGKDVGGA